MLHLKHRQFLQLRTILVILAVAGVVVSVYLESNLLALLVIGTMMVIGTFLKTRVTDKPDDERLRTISEKATMTAFRILVPILGLTSVALVHGGNDKFYYLQALGLILSYVTCLALIIYLIAYLYYNKKYGG